MAKPLATMSEQTQPCARGGMPAGILRRVKRAILRSGAPPLKRLEFFCALLAYGRWLREHPAPAHFPHRTMLYDHVIEGMSGEPFDFLEFGVFRGESIMYWAGKAKHPECRFYGFDSFKGLPGDWHTGIRTIPKSEFDVKGEPPVCGDKRVKFLAGWFHETVPAFARECGLQRRRVFHFDADLYSSTLFVLASMNGLITAGSILLFDNFSVATHDFRAFTDWQQAFAREFSVMASAEIDFEKIAMGITA